MLLEEEKKYHKKKKLKILEVQGWWSGIHSQFYKWP